MCRRELPLRVIFPADEPRSSAVRRLAMVTRGKKSVNRLGQPAIATVHLLSSGRKDKIASTQGSSVTCEVIFQEESVDGRLAQEDVGADQVLLS